METPSNIPNTPAPLDYGTKPSPGWISRHRRILIFLSLCISIATPIGWYWQSIQQRVLWIYWSRQAAAFQMPAQAIDLVIADPEKARRTAATNPNYRFMPPANFAIHLPQAYLRLAELDSRVCSLGGEDFPIAFMGTLWRPDGAPRLVIIKGRGGIPSNIMSWTSVLVLPPPRWTDPLPPPAPARIQKFFSYPVFAQTVMNSGVPDPQDPSHLAFGFTIEPEQILLKGDVIPWTTGGHGIMDARLGNDDSITFTLRSYSGADRNVRIGTVGRTSP